MTNRIIDNPFSAIGPANPKHYANRKELLSFFKKNILNPAKSKITKPDNILLLGDWGIGKTSTLIKFEHILRKELKQKVRSFFSIFALKPSYCIDFKIFTKALLDNLKKEYSINAPRSSKSKEKIKEWIKTWELSEISLSPKVKRKTKQRDLDIVVELEKFWKTLSSYGIEIAVIMIDDIHYLIDSYGKGLYDLRTDIQSLNSKGCKFVFVFAGNLDAYPQMHDIAEPFTRLFEKYKLETFDYKNTKELIELPIKVEKIGLKIQEGVIRKIHELSEGHPFFVTQIMKDMINFSNKKVINIKEFNKIYPKIAEHLARTKFSDQMVKLPNTEKKAIEKISKLKKETFTPSDLKVKSANKIIERLTEKNIVSRLERGKYKLYHNLFKEYVLTKKS